MENSAEIQKAPLNNPVANNSKHYTLLTFGAFITFFGAILRFLGEAIILDMVSNGVFLVGVIISFIAVMRILKS